MERPVSELLEELEKVFPDFLDTNKLIDMGFTKKIVDEALGYDLVNYQMATDPNEPRKIWISDKGFLVVYQIQIKKSIEKLDESIKQFSKISTYLSMVIIFLTVVIIGLTAVQIFFR